MSALVASVAQPRAVVVALHGGAVTSAYYDSRVSPGLSLLETGGALGFTVIALDRPGYGASAYAAADRIASSSGRVDLAFWAIDEMLAGRSRGAGVFLLGHSMGCVLAVQMAADPRGAGLLGLEIAGIGVRPHPRARTFMRVLTAGASGAGWPPLGNGAIGNGAGHGAAARSVATRGGGNLRDLLWTPARLYPDGAEAALGLCASPGYEGDDVRGLADAFPSLAARVRVPVRYTLGDHERVWSNGPAALASIAALFSQSPRVVAAEQSATGHNLSLGRSALAYHLSVLAFAEECALIKECADRVDPDGG
jgi:pimeloyl-ACP methyl ester carboxylesterase